MVGTARRSGPPGIRGRPACVLGAALLATLVLSSCGTAADPPVTQAGPPECVMLPPADLLRLDGQAMFAASFAMVRCESEAITADDVIEGGTLAIVAPSPGFTDPQLVSLVTDLLEPAGLRASAIHWYVLATDRVTVARLGPYGSIEETLQWVTSALADAFAEDGRTGAEDRVAWILEVETDAASVGALARVLDELRDGGYAFMIGANVAFSPPFDPARDRSAAEWQDRLGS